MTERLALIAAALFLLLVGAKLFLPEQAQRLLPQLQGHIDRDSLALPEETIAWLDWR